MANAKTIPMAKFAPRAKLSIQQQEKLLVDFFRSLASVKNPAEAAKVISDLLSPQELDMVAKRLAIARLLLAGEKYGGITQQLKVSFGTIARISVWLQEAGDGFRLVVGRLGRSPREYGRDHRWSHAGEGFAELKRRYPQYFWPQRVLERIISSADRKELAAMKLIIKRSKQKTRVLKQINRILASERNFNTT